MRQTGEPIPQFDGAVQVGVHSGLACVLGRDGVVRCWGHYAHPKCHAPEIYEVEGLEPVVQISVARHACALEVNGTVKCWGRGDGGMMGVPEPKAEMVFQPQVIDVGGPVVKVSIHAHSAVALRADGQVWMWGNDILPGDVEVAKPPMHVEEIEAAVDVVASSSFGCALLPDHNLRCFGQNMDEDREGDKPLPVEPKEAWVKPWKVDMAGAMVPKAEP